MDSGQRAACAASRSGNWPGGHGSSPVPRRARPLRLCVRRHRSWHSRAQWPARPGPARSGGGELTRHRAEHCGAERAATARADRDQPAVIAQRTSSQCVGRFAEVHLHGPLVADDASRRFPSSAYTGGSWIIIGTARPPRHPARRTPGGPSTPPRECATARVACQEPSAASCAGTTSPGRGGARQLRGHATQERCGERTAAARPTDDQQLSRLLAAGGRVRPLDGAQGRPSCRARPRGSSAATASSSSRPASDRARRRWISLATSHRQGRWVDPRSRGRG